MVGQTFTSMLVDDIDDAEDDGNSDDDVCLAVLAGRGHRSSGTATMQSE